MKLEAKIKNNFVDTRKSKSGELISKNRTYVQKIEKYLKPKTKIKIKMIEAMNSKVKAKIIKYFALSKKEASISEIAKNIGVSKSRASEVLKILENKGILTSKKIGRSLIYKINENNKKAIEILKFVKKISLNDIEEIKKSIIPILKKHGVIRASIFGSVARGEAKEGSDIDILVELPKEKSLLDLVRLENELKEKLKRDVDVVEYNSIHPLLKEIILKEEVRLYEKG